PADLSGWGTPETGLPPAGEADASAAGVPTASMQPAVTTARDSRNGRDLGFDIETPLGWGRWIALSAPRRSYPRRSSGSSVLRRFTSGCRTSRREDDARL